MHDERNKTLISSVNTVERVVGYVAVVKVVMSKLYRVMVYMHHCLIMSHKIPPPPPQAEVISNESLSLVRK